MSTQIRIIELFAGIGGFRKGFENANETIARNDYKEDRTTKSISRRLRIQCAGDCSDTPSTRRQQQQRFYTCIYANEWDKYARSIYEKNFNTEIDPRDIRTVKTSEIPEHDVLTGGFPCQAFSIAGHRLGFEDTRGTLFFEIARILQDKRPRYFLLENVKGLLSHDSGQTFQTILAILSELGYDIQWDVLNSKNFSVPQNRERVFIIGYLRGERRPEIFPIGTEDSRFDDRVISTAIDGNYWKGPDKHGQRTLIHNVYGGFGETKFREFKEYSPTIRTPKGGGHLPMVKDDMRIRRLTPIECERLQGFPDGWTDGISDTQRYKCLGNAVTVSVIEAIALKLYENIKEE